MDEEPIFQCILTTSTSEKQREIDHVSEFHLEGVPYRYFGTQFGVKQNILVYENTEGMFIVKLLKQKEFYSTQLALKKSSKTVKPVAIVTSRSLLNSLNTKYSHALIMRRVHTLDSICLDNLTMELAVSACEQMLQGLKEYHYGKFIHRDVNMKNLLFDKRLNQLSFIDFGISISFVEERDNIAYLDGNMPLSGIYSTKTFMAPEVYSFSDYGTKIDMYSCGVCCLQLFASVVGKYRMFRQRETAPNIDDVKILFEEHPLIAPYQELVMKLMDEAPATRWSAEQALKELKIIQEKQMERLSKKRDVGALSTELQPKERSGLSYVQVVQSPINQLPIKRSKSNSLEGLTANT